MFLISHTSNNLNLSVVQKRNIDNTNLLEIKQTEQVIQIFDTVRKRNLTQMIFNGQTVIF